ncbi:MAG: hypothetical protein HND57_17395 [Planctomycetes bacterium]|nr:hypothetical protein [Planctomycetota bacterium]
MCRQSYKTRHARTAGRLVVRLGCILMVVLGLAVDQLSAQTAVDPDDPLEGYLSAHGLEDLIVTHLEMQLRQTLLEEERVQLAGRLALMYGRLLDASKTDDQRSVWEEKSAELLDLVPGANTEALQINILKATYLRAERLAEKYRLRAVGDEQRLQARRMMTEVSSSLASTYRDIMMRVLRLEQRDFTEAPRAEYEQASSELRTLDALASQAAYYAAWAHYYRAELSDPHGDVNEALRLFGHTLQSDYSQPRLEELPESLLAFEHVARAALGVALCYALRGETNTALDWLDQLDTPETAAGVLEQLDAYRLWVLFLHRGYDEINLWMDETSAGDQVSVPAARLITVCALEQVARSSNDEATALAARGITELTQQGQLSQVIDLAEQYDLEALRNDDFIITYVLGLQAHERARAAHGSESPTQDPQILALYAEAERRLQAVLDHRDGSAQYRESVAQARLLLAGVAYFQGHYREAADAYAVLSMGAARDEAESAHWMWIVALDHLRTDAAAAGDMEQAGDWEAELDQSMRLFLDAYPSSSRAGRIRYRLAANDTGPATRERVDLLLAVPPDSPDYKAARHEAERMLYSLFRAATAADRSERALEYLNLARPILTNEHRLVFATALNDADTKRYLDRARRVLDVQLTRGVARLSDARALLDRLRTAEAAGLIDLTALDAEFQYRQIQIQILSGDWESGAEWAERLWTEDKDNRYARLAIRELFALAVQDWRAYPADPRLVGTLLRAYSYGQRLLDAEPLPLDLSDQDVIALAAVVAEASLELTDRQQDETGEYLKQASTLYAQLLTQRPRNVNFLKGSARVAEHEGDNEKALQHWRTCLSGLDPSTTAWYEAKYHVIRLLADADPTYAREVMRQHQLLYPGFGPEPWGSLIAEISERLSHAGDPQPDSDDSSGAESETGEGDGG